MRCQAGTDSADRSSSRSSASYPPVVRCCAGSACIAQIHTGKIMYGFHAATRATADTKQQHTVSAHPQRLWHTRSPSSGLLCDPLRLLFPPTHPLTHPPYLTPSPLHMMIQCLRAINLQRHAVDNTLSDGKNATKNRRW